MIKETLYFLKDNRLKLREIENRADTQKKNNINLALWLHN